MFKIGDEELFSIAGMPELPKQQLQIVERPGVDGAGLFDLGKHGKPFQVVSKCDYADIQAAHDAAARYCALIEGPPLQIVHGDVNYSGYGVYFQVLDVKAGPPRGLVNAAGGVNPPSQAWMEAAWTLLPLPIPAE